MNERTVSVGVLAARKRIEEEQRITKEKAKATFSGSGRIMTWLLVGGGSRIMNIPKDVRGNMTNGDANRVRNSLTDLMDKCPEEVKVARKRIQEERCKPTVVSPHAIQARELVSV